MHRIEDRTHTPAEPAALAAARGDDQAAFAALAERSRRELHIHCYRLVGSFEDAEDLVQETFLRAWRRRASFEGRSTFRAWLYAIATNACLDALERRPRVATPPAGAEAVLDVPWLQAYPDPLLDEAAPDAGRPEAALVAKETIELAYVAAIQLLPPRQRAVLVARDVLDWSASETAALLDLTVPTVTSALQRARATLARRLPAPRVDWPGAAGSSAEERALLDRYIAATEAGDAAAMKELLREDARFAMPPQPELYTGRATVVDSWVEGGFGSAAFGHLRALPTRANRQPAAANYHRRPGDAVYRALALDVLRMEGGLVAEILAFPADDFDAYGLPSTLPADDDAVRDESATSTGSQPS